MKQHESNSVAGIILLNKETFCLFFFPSFLLLVISKKMNNSNEWSPSSWKSKPIVQDVVYEDQAHFDRVLNKLNRLPPLVSASEVSCVRNHKDRYKSTPILD
jgi:type I restriction-modification system DNA methylase subunit